MFRARLFLCAMIAGLMFVWIVVGVSSRADAATSRCEDKGYIYAYFTVGDVITAPTGDLPSYRTQLCHMGKNGKLRIHKSIANTPDEIAGLRKYAKKFAAYLCRPSEDRAYMIVLAHGFDYHIKKLSFVEQVYYPEWVVRYAWRHNCHI